jgi:hypothetical protein
LQVALDYACFQPGRGSPTWGEHASVSVGGGPFDASRPPPRMLEKDEIGKTVKTSLAPPRRRTRAWLEGARARCAGGLASSGMAGGRHDANEQRPQRYQTRLRCVVSRV